MAIESNIIKIKRSGTSGAPASLKLGELAYSYLTASGNPTSNGGDRLFIGANGVNGGTGNANDVIVIGGKYFTDLLDHERGILTASSALVVDGNKKLDELLVDNLSLNGNTLSTTDTNGNLTLSPNGTGLVSIAGAFTLPRADGTAGYALITNGSGVVSWTQISTTLNIAGTTGTDGVSLTSDTLTFAGATTPVSIAVTDNTVTIAVADATTSAKGLASFNSTDFTVTTGAVTVNEERIQDIIGAMVDSNTETNTSVSYDDATGKLNFSVATATSSVLGVASFDATDFTVTTGAVTVNAERIQDIIGDMVSTNTESGISVTYDDVNGKLDFNVSDPVITIAGDVDGFATMTNLGDTTITVTLDTVNTNTGSFGSSTAIPVITVNGKGLITAVTTASISTTLNIAGNTGTDGVALGSDTLTITGTGAISTAVTDNQVAISVATATSSVKGVATFNTSGFVVTSGDVALKADVAQSVTGDTGTATPATNSFKVAGTSAQGISTSATGSTVTVTASDATSSQKGVATFNTGGFVVTSGDVALKGDVVQSVTTDSGALTVASNAISILGGEGIDVTHSGTTITVAGEDASTSNKGIAQFSTNFAVTSGVVELDTSLVGIDSITGSTAGNVVIDAGNSKTWTFGTDGNLSVSGKITNLTDPTSAQDAATKAYVDAVKTGLDVKESVRAATTANITLSNTQTIDGVALAVGDRVLVKDQSTGSANGIYVVASGSWTRAEDCDNTPGTEVTSGLFTFVEEGTSFADSGFVLTSNGAITVGTTALSFVQFSGAGQITAGLGLSKTGNTLDVNVANGIEISGDNVQLASTVAGDGLTYTNGVLDVVGTADRISVTANAVDIASTYVGQNTITTLGTVGTGTWQANVITYAYGGTGQSTWAKGDLLYASASNTLSKLTAGTNGQALQLQDGLPVWGDLDGGTY